MELGIWLIAATVFILLATIDFRLYIIPDELTALLIVLGVGVTILNGAYLNHFIAAGIGLAFFGIVVLLTKGQGMGMGDVKLAGAIGLLLGMPNTIFAFTLAFVTGALFGVGLIIMKKKGLKDAVPFGPFLVLGVFLALILDPYLEALFYI